MVSRLRPCSGSIKRPFANPSCVKSHDWIVLIGDLEKLLLSSVLPREYALWLLMFSEWVKLANSAQLTLAQIDFTPLEIYEVLAEMEVLFPVFMCTINFHFLIHLPTTLRLFGPGIGHQIFYIERFNRTLKAAVKVSCKQEFCFIIVFFLLLKIEKQQSAINPNCSVAGFSLFHEFCFLKNFAPI